MKKLIIIFAGLLIIAPACKKKKKVDKKVVKTKTTKKSGKKIKDTKKPVKVVKEKIFKKHKKMDALIINAGKKCKKAFMPKCQELKDLRQFVSDIWMNKIKMSKQEKLEAYVTAINLLLHKDKKTASFAVRGTINGYVYSHKMVYKNPELLPKKYVLKMLKAVPKMVNDSDMGFIMQDVAEFAPAYNLTGEMFKVAKANLKKNKDLIVYVLENMVKFEGYKMFKYAKEYSKDLKNIPQMVGAIKATMGILEKKLTKKQRKEICEYSDKFIPAKLDKKSTEEFYFSIYAYRYMDVVTMCKRYEAIKNVKKLGTTKELKKEVKNVVKKLTFMKEIIEKKKKIKELKEEKDAKKLKKNLKKVDKIKKDIEKLKKKIEKIK
jgi:hypothetical protein